MKVGNPSAIVREYMEKGYSDTCPIVDMHGHLGPNIELYLPAAPLDRMTRSLQRAGVRTIVCSPHEALMADPMRGNALMQATIDRFPGQFLGYWAINPHYPQLLESLGRDFACSHGFVGLKCLPDYHTYPITGARYRPALEYADAHRLLVLVHTWGGSPFDAPSLFGKVAGEYPGATFLMGHSGFGDWDAAIALARELPNVYLELTAVYAAHDFGNQPGGSGTPLPLLSCLHVNGIIEQMVSGASAQKIVFGTDLPWYSPHYAAGAVLFARISDEDRHDILHRNAERLLGQCLEVEMM